MPPQIQARDPVPGIGAEGEDTFFDVNLRRAYLEDAPSLIGSVVGSGTSFPGTPANGQLFFRTDTGKLYIYDGTDWRQLLVAQANGTTRMPGRTVQE
ncbi:hypothetical protein LCGC14_2021940 [marine sediment metagenome]|uniref:Uncharacterized protein n=1 Tax=marine sediment metagenome TaxID=412755 RepID=A0A0F9FJR4_9ZZZZ